MLQAIALNQSRGTVSVIVAVLNSVGIALTANLSDVAILTGGRVLADVTGVRPRSVQAAHSVPLARQSSPAKASPSSEVEAIHAQSTSAPPM